MNIDKFLMQLDRVKSTGHNKWLACCPAHNDKTPSLAIRMIDHRLLFHCFGCGANGIEICQALDIDPSELFADKISKRERVPFPADHILAALAKEATIISNAAANMGKLSQADIERVEVARNRIIEGLNYAK